MPLQDDNSLLFFVVVEAIITALNFVAMWLMAFWKELNTGYLDYWRFNVYSLIGLQEYPF